MRILHLCLGNFFIDNCSYQENLLPKYHVLQGHEVTVIASLFTYDEKGKGTYLQEPSRYEDKNGYRVIRLAYKTPIRWNRFFRHYKGLLRTIEEINPDIIFSHNVSYGDTGVVRAYLRKHPNVKLFADNHADYINSSKNLLSKYILHPIIWRHYVKMIEPFMTRCYGVTPLRCEFLIKEYRINPSIVHYLPLGIDDELIPKNRESVRSSIRKEVGIGEDDFLIFTGGKIDRLKNTHYLIEALSRINNPRMHLIVCGVLTPEMDFLKQKIESDVNIHYLGWCDAERVMNCMVASDLACFPGTHSTLWEQSVGIGLPAIFKHWDGMSQVNVNGNCVFVTGDNVEELEHAIVELFFTERYQELRIKAKKASSSFLYSHIAQIAIDDSFCFKNDILNNSYDSKS